MDSRVLIHLHHHGDFTSETFKGNANYVGGKVDIMENVDTKKLTMLTIQSYSMKYKYSRTDFVYFQTDGHSFRRGIRLVYDDDSLSNMIEVSLPYKRINLFVDHKKRFAHSTDPPKSVTFVDKLKMSVGVEGTEKDVCSEDDSDDPLYEYNSEEETDEELVVARKERKQIKDASSESSGDEYDVDEYPSDELMPSFSLSIEPFKVITSTILYRIE